jgi:hypothetical protein
MPCNVMVVPQIRLQLLPFTHFTVHCLLIILPFSTNAGRVTYDAMKWAIYKLNAVTWNDLQVSNYTCVFNSLRDSHLIELFIILKPENFIMRLLIITNPKQATGHPPPPTQNILCFMVSILLFSWIVIFGDFFMACFVTLLKSNSYNIYICI